MCRIEYRLGTGAFTLAECMKAHKISRLTKRADLQCTQISLCYSDAVQRPDSGELCGTCYALDCGIADILAYAPQKTEPSGTHLPTRGALVRIALRVQL